MELSGIFAPVAEEMREVNAQLTSFMQRVSQQTAAARGKRGILERIVAHPFAVPGKRVRPALTLLAAGALGGAPDRGSLVALAAGVEILHAASLVHDDVIDAADSRRHQVSLNKRFGNRVAVLAGDILYTHFFSLVTGLTAIEPNRRFAILDDYIDTTKAMCTGEILAQEVRAGGKTMSFEDYVEIAADKTAVLFAVCLRTAGHLCGLDAAGRERVAAIGMDFGLAFQMADDLVDGDHGLGPEVDLKKETLDRARRARDGISSMAPGPCRESLLQLVEYVVSPAIP